MEMLYNKNVYAAAFYSVVSPPATGSETAFLFSERKEVDETLRIL
ncbi:hypothetical protein M493_15525 [Geobacillus genomosp. 3]|uniref:Uncharacterized protein n=1 Tax=Geobacillus genomosp. 3 TaxID=1921421 RepID=S6A3S0_GEOG3|nr:hypothetical protein M493_15525 [Geobacillus genomosp. 3]